jgi:hypothetical protein
MTAGRVLPYDPHDPPVNPPADCENRLMWQLARRLFADHQPGADGWCAICRPYQYYPCVGRQLADIGMRAAYHQPDGAPWRSRPATATEQRGWWSP